MARACRHAGAEVHLVFATLDAPGRSVHEPSPHALCVGQASGVLAMGASFGPLPFAWGVEAFGSYTPVLVPATALPALV